MLIMINIITPTTIAIMILITLITTTRRNVTMRNYFC